MNTIIMILFFTGIIVTIMGYYKTNQNCPINKVKHVFIPKTVEEDQAYPQSVTEIYRKMFSQPSLIK